MNKYHFMDNFKHFIEMKTTKLFHCNIHGPIRISPVALAIINTVEFQRLREIKQLSCVYLVYPSAMHTRFEHSIGVYYLAGQMLDNIKKMYPEKIFNVPHLGQIKLDDFIMEMIMIAGLCHDIGHGPFSHTFDDIFLKSLISKEFKSDEFIKMASHENRSCKIIEKIIMRELSDILGKKHIDFITSLIHPDPNKGEKGALYQIISNYLNGIDVDKFDYLMRDAHNIGLKQGIDIRPILHEFIIDNNDNICFPKHSSMNIYSLFNHRYMMHRNIYNHKTVKNIENMICDIFELIEPVFKISETILDMDKFCELTDHNILHMIENYNYQHTINNVSDEFKSNIKKAHDLLADIKRRNLYRYIADLQYHDIDNLKIKLDEFLTNYPEYDPNDFYIIQYKIGLVGGNQSDPFSTIYFYDRKEDSNTFTMKRTDVSPLIANEFQEINGGIVCKNKHIYEDVKIKWV